MKRVLVRFLFRIGWWFDAAAVHLDRTLYTKLWLASSHEWQQRHGKEER